MVSGKSWWVSSWWMVHDSSWSWYQDIWGKHLEHNFKIASCFPLCLFVLRLYNNLIGQTKMNCIAMKIGKSDILLELPTFGSPVCFDNSFDLQATIAGRNEAGPHKITDTMAFMFESFLMPRTCPWALDSPFRDHDYYQCLIGLKSHFSCEKTNGKTTDLQNGLMEMRLQSHHEWFGLETLTLALSSYLIN